ncbi:hypothetical protein EXIGLDRAFT_205252 [Exidia glandulosa HHB12029]|uniref:Uncharacterized protein n=1 Tax=Exidia glandulosa HHB12029 TaxID=1314781 RepID=A0A166BBZ9_EXIGL|nr:hypothetical protein EXIGLDRAFT_205252 [Exidia glandulosa HHB12029]
MFRLYPTFAFEASRLSTRVQNDVQPLKRSTSIAITAEPTSFRICYASSTSFIFFFGSKTTLRSLITSGPRGRKDLWLSKPHASLARTQFLSPSTYFATSGSAPSVFARNPSTTVSFVPPARA